MFHPGDRNADALETGLSNLTEVLLRHRGIVAVVRVGIHVAVHADALAQTLIALEGKFGLGGDIDFLIKYRCDLGGVAIEVEHEASLAQDGILRLHRTTYILLRTEGHTYLQMVGSVEDGHTMIGHIHL